MVGRGTRIHPGKENLLLLDFLWISRQHSLAKPASLIAHDECEQAAIESVLNEVAGEDQLAAGDLVGALDESRERALARQILAQRKLKGEVHDLLDIIDLCIAYKAPELESYAPTMHWHVHEVTANQVKILEKYRVDLSCVQDRGHASAIIDTIIRYNQSLPATFRQISFLLCHYLYEPTDLINLNCDYRLNAAGRVDIIGAGVTKSAADWCKWFAAEGVPQSQAGCWFRINPVLTQQGSGKTGAFTDNDIARFAYHLFEIDAVPRKLQLSLFCRIHIPVAMISDSGGRSCHALVKSFARTLIEYEAESEHLHEIYGAYGIDPKNRNPSRYSRLPGVIRNIGARPLSEGESEARQRILFLNPQPDSTPIL